MENLTVTQVAIRLKKEPRTIRNWIKTGKLKASKPGGKEYLISSELIEQIERGE